MINGSTKRSLKFILTHPEAPPVTEWKVIKSCLKQIRKKFFSNDEINPQHITIIVVLNELTKKSIKRQQLEQAEAIWRM